MLFRSFFDQRVLGACQTDRLVHRPGQLRDQVGRNLVLGDIEPGQPPQGNPGVIEQLLRLGFADERGLEAFLRLLLVGDRDRASLTPVPRSRTSVWWKAVLSWLAA